MSLLQIIKLVPMEKMSAFFAPSSNIIHYFITIIEHYRETNNWTILKQVYDVIAELISYDSTLERYQQYGHFWELSLSLLVESGKQELILLFTRIVYALFPVCKYCPKHKNKFAYSNGGTKNLMNHLKSQHKARLSIYFTTKFKDPARPAVNVQTYFKPKEFTIDDLVDTMVE